MCNRGWITMFIAQYFTKIKEINNPIFALLIKSLINLLIELNFFFIY